MRRWTLAALTLLLALPALTAAQDRCEVRREVDRQIDAGGLEGVLIEARAGSLEVMGTDAERIRVRGVLCASDDELAADARLVLERRQDAAWVEAHLPDGGWMGDYARMDLVVEMPRALAADIQDGSGSIEVRDIAGVGIKDGSGGIRVEELGGDVRIEDGSGEIYVRGAGSVRLDDSSGSVEIYETAGDVVVIEDGSGSIEIRDVTGSVRIEEDGSGSILVVGVAGDFILEDDGSGSVRYRDIQGRVSVPD